MKKTLVKGLIASALVSANALLNVAAEQPTFTEAESEIYPDCGIVTEVNLEKDKVTVTGFNGNKFTFSGTLDWEVGDIAAMMLDNNKTKEVADDIVVKAHYRGWVF